MRRALAFGGLANYVWRHFNTPVDPRIEVARDVDVGDRDQSETVEISLPVKNRGGTKLEICNISTSCGCASLATNGDTTGERLQYIVIEPRGETVVPIILRVRGQAGEINERIAFETNDPLEPTVEIRLKAMVFPGVRFSSPFVDCGYGRPGTTARSTVTLLDGRRSGNKSALRLRHDRTEVAVGSLADASVESGIGTNGKVELKYVLPLEMRFPARVTEVKDRLVVTDETGYGLCSLAIYGLK